MTGWPIGGRLMRYRPVFMVVQVMLCIISLAFYYSTFFPQPLMRAETWGTLAYELPARWWAAYGVVAAALTWAGLRIPVRNWMVTAGAVMQCAQYVVLSWSAVFTGGEPVVGIYVYLFFLPLHLWILIETWHGRSDD